MKLKRVDLNNTSIEELTEAIKYNCIVTEQMEQKMEVLEKGTFSKNRIQTQQIQKQTPITTPREQPENNDEKDFLIPYIETFNSYHPEERKEFLQMTEQNIEESEYIRLLILLQLQSARNLIELKEIVEPNLKEEELAYIRSCVTEEQGTRELVSGLLKEKETAKIAKVIKRGTLK